ncbi:MAG: hypothetical protein J6N76_01040 [Lachnospiraceae bacterium]|nr:hypothetical protein [Lachnospiraceae bacterium]
MNSVGFIPYDEYDFEMEDRENTARVGKDKAFALELSGFSTLADDLGKGTGA